MNVEMVKRRHTQKYPSCAIGWRVRVLGILALWLVVAVGSGRPVAALDMTVNNVQLQTLVTSIAKSEHLQIMGAESLHGTESAHLKETNGIEAIKRLAALKHFSVYEDKGVWIVDGAGMDSKESRSAMVYSPQHVPAPTLIKALKAVVGESHMEVVPEMNQILINGTPGELRQVRAVLPQLDQAPRQVRLEVAVMAVAQSYAKETGIRWSWRGLLGHGERTSNGAHSTDSSSNGSGSFDTSEYGAIRFGKFDTNTPYTFWVKPDLSLSETSDKSLIIAKPSIMTVNGEEAKILIGDRIPVLVETREGDESRTTVRYEEAGIRLTCTPFVSTDDSIDAEIQAEVSNPSLVSELKAYRITTREAHTRVHLKKGEILVIGGLMDNRNEKQFSKVPILGDIPLLGKLFQYARKTKDKVELYIFVKATTEDW